MDPYFQTLFADRIGGVNYGKGTEIYKFEKIKRAKRKALADFPNRPLIDFGIGENDGVAPESVRRKMADKFLIRQPRKPLLVHDEMRQGWSRWSAAKQRTQ